MPSLTDRPLNTATGTPRFRQHHRQRQRRHRLPSRADQQHDRQRQHRHRLRRAGRNTTGTDNVATGSGRAVANTTGNSNVATGPDALLINTTGDNNVATGINALLNATGDEQRRPRPHAGKNLTTGSNNVDIANPGKAGESGTIRIGTDGTQTATFIAGISGTTSAPGPAGGRQRQTASSGPRRQPRRPRHRSRRPSSGSPSARAPAAPDRAASRAGEGRLIEAA